MSETKSTSSTSTTAWARLGGGVVATLKWAAALGVIAASSAMNGLLAWQMSHAAPWPLAVAATAALVGVDWLKPWAPLAAEQARQAGRVGHAWALRAAWGLAVAVSLAAAIGATALVRAQTEMAARTAIEARQALKRQIAGLEAELRQLPATGLPEAVLREKIRAVLADPRAEGCARLNGPYTRKYCPQVSRWREQIGLAARRAKITRRLAALRGRLAAIKAPAVADPQAARLAWAAGLLLRREVSVAEVQNALSLLIAVLVESFAALALVLARGDGGKGHRVRRRRRRGGVPTRPASDDDRLAWLRARGHWNDGQRALAAAWGISLGKVNRLLRQWQAAGLVELGRGRIAVL